MWSRWSLVIKVFGFLLFEVFAYNILIFNYLYIKTSVLPHLKSILTIDLMTIDNARDKFNNNLTKNKPYFEGKFNISAKFPTPM